MPPTNDNLSIDLVINDRDATVKLDSFKGNLVKAEIEASRLGTAGSVAFEKLGGGANRSIQPLQLAKGQAQQLSFQINDIATSLASGASPFQVMAQQGGQVIQAFGGVNGTLAATKAALAAVGLSLGGLAVFGGLAAAGLAVVKITESIRTEAERRLKAEEAIVAAMNRQRLLGIEIAKNTERVLKQDAADDQFSQFLKNGSIDDLQRRLENIRRLQNVGGNTDVGVDPKTGKAIAVESEASKRRVEELRRLEQEIRERGRQTSSDRSNVFEQQAENYKKSQESARKAQEEFAKSVEEGRKKVGELGKTYNAVLDGIVQRSNANNPFVQLFSEADRSMKVLRENTRGLSRDVIAQFEAMEQKANSLKLFEARIESGLGALGLRNEAANFRNPVDPEKNRLQQDAIIRQFLADNPNYGNSFFGGSGDFRSITYDQNGNMDEATRRDILSRSQLGRNTLETPADRLNKTLQDQFNLLNQNARSPDEQRIADRRFAALTQGVNPLELSDRNREAAAAVREREAVRIESAEKEAIDVARESRDLQKRIAESQEKLLLIAEKQGIRGVEIAIRDGTSGGVDVKSPTSSDTGSLYGGGITF